jgi:hypothetical protein
VSRDEWSLPREAEEHEEGDATLGVEAGGGGGVAAKEAGEAGGAGRNWGGATRR